MLVLAVKMHHIWWNDSCVYQYESEAYLCKQPKLKQLMIWKLSLVLTGFFVDVIIMSYALMKRQVSVGVWLCAAASLFCTEPRGKRKRSRMLCKDVCFCLEMQSVHLWVYMEANTATTAMCVFVRGCLFMHIIGCEGNVKYIWGYRQPADRSFKLPSTSSLAVEDLLRPWDGPWIIIQFCSFFFKPDLWPPYVHKREWLFFA